MIDILPFIAGIVTLFFGIAFYFGLQEFKDLEDKSDKSVGP